MKPNWRTHAILLLTLFALNVAVKSTLWMQPPQTFPDSLGYIAPAMRLLDGLGYGSQENGFRTPTYPLFIAAIVSPFDHSRLSECREVRVPACLGEAQNEPSGQVNLRAVVTAQIILSFAIILLVYGFAWQASQNAWIAALCTLTYPIDLSTGYWEISLLTDTVTTCLLALAVWLTPLAARSRRHRRALCVTLGLVLAVLALAHSVYLVYAVIPAAFLWWHARCQSNPSPRQVADPSPWKGEDRVREGVALAERDPLACFSRVPSDEAPWAERDPHPPLSLPGRGENHGHPQDSVASSEGRTGSRDQRLLSPPSNAPAKSLRVRWGAWSLAAVVLIPALAVIGWSTRNWIVDGYFTPSTISGYNLTQMVGPFMEQAPAAYRDLAEIYLDYRADRIAARGSHSGTIFFAYRDMMHVRETTWAGLSQMLTSMSVQLVARNPTGYLHIAGQSFVQFWKFGLGRQNSTLPLSYEWVRWTLDARIHQALAVLFLLAPVALAGWQATHRDQAAATIWIWFAVATVLYAALFSSALNFGDNERYRTHVARLQYSAIIMTAWVYVRGRTSFPRPGRS